MKKDLEGNPANLWFATEYQLITDARSGSSDRAVCSETKQFCPPGNRQLCDAFNVEMLLSPD